MHFERGRCSCDGSIAQEGGTDGANSVLGGRIVHKLRPQKQEQARCVTPSERSLAAKWGRANARAEASHGEHDREQGSQLSSGDGGFRHDEEDDSVLSEKGVGHLKQQPLPLSALRGAPPMRRPSAAMSGLTALKRGRTQPIEWEESTGSGAKSTAPTVAREPSGLGGLLWRAMRVSGGSANGKTGLSFPDLLSSVDAMQSDVDVEASIAHPGESCSLSRVDLLALRKRELNAGATGVADLASQKERPARSRGKDRIIGAALRRRSDRQVSLRCEGSRRGGEASVVGETSSSSGSTEVAPPPYAPAPPPQLPGGPDITLESTHPPDV